VPRRDWILLPALSLLTICLMFVSTELIARWLFPTLPTVGEDCMVFDDLATGARGIPNSVCWEKLPDGELTEYRFNSCGHRAGMECGLKTPGTYRIVMLGSSIATGMRVPREETFAALLPAELSQRTGRNVELYNEGMPWRSPSVIALHFDEVLATKPDMVLWVLSPTDIWNDSLLSSHHPESSPVPDSKASAPGRTAGLVLAALYRVMVAFAQRSVPDVVRNLWDRRETGFLLRHYLYESQSQYVMSYLMRARDVEYLRVEPSEEWQTHVQQLDGITAEVEARARAADVPLVAVLVPERAQAAMISMGEWPTGFDPYKLDNELRSMVISHGGTYIDILPALRHILNPEKGYFSVDGHPDAHGHAMISGLLATELTSGAVPALKVATRSQAASGQGR
jgi:hypothetical protein